MFKLNKFSFSAGCFMTYTLLFAVFSPKKVRQSVICLTLSFTGFLGNVHAQNDTCSKHGKSAEGCGFCIDGKVKVGQGTAFTFPWNNTSDGDIVIRKEPSAKLEFLPGQRAVQIGTTKDFGGVIKDSVVWFGGRNNSFVSPVFKGTRLLFIEIKGAFILTEILSGFKTEEPAIVLKLTVDIAEYDFDTRQTGLFKPSTQCAVFYKAE